MKCIKQLKLDKTNVQKDINKSGGTTDFSVSGKLRSFQTASCMNPDNLSARGLYGPLKGNKQNMYSLNL